MSSFLPWMVLFGVTSWVFVHDHRALPGRFFVLIATTQRHNGNLDASFNFYFYQLLAMRTPHREFRLGIEYAVPEDYFRAVGTITHME